MGKGNTSIWGIIVAVAMVAFVRLPDASAQAVRRDTSADYVLDKVYLPTLEPVVSFGLGGSYRGNDLLALRSLMRPQEQIYAAQRYSITPASPTFAQVGLVVSVRVRLNSTLSLRLDASHSGTYASASACGLITLPVAAGALFFVGAGAGYYSFDFVQQYGAYRSAGGGYDVLDNIEYSGGVFGSRTLLGVDIATHSLIGLELFGAYNMPLPLKDPLSATKIDLGGYEVGLELMLHFWQSSSSSANTR